MYNTTIIKLYKTRSEKNSPKGKSFRLSTLLKNFPTEYKKIKSKIKINNQIIILFPEKNQNFLLIAFFFLGNDFLIDVYITLKGGKKLLIYPY